MLLDCQYLSIVDCETCADHLASLKNNVDTGVGAEASGRVNEELPGDEAEKIENLSKN